MKILITTGVYPPEGGGPATYTKLLEERLPQFGIDVSVLPFRVVRHLPKFVRHVVFLLKVLRRGRGVDVLYTQDVGSVGFPSLIAATLLRKRFAVRVPGDYAWEQGTQRFGVVDGIDDFQNKRYGFRVEMLRWVQRLIVGHADLVITPSKYFAALVSKWTPKPITVRPVYNGIEMTNNLPTRHDARRHLGIGEDERVLLSIGRLVPWKGLATVIDVAVRLHERDPRWRLVIVGEGPERPVLERSIATHNADGYITLVGEKNRDDVFAYYRAADVFVHNSSFESFSFQTVEAMRAGTPFVGTAVGSIPELVTDGTEGLLVKPDDRDALGEAILRIADDDAFRLAITAAASKKVDMFSIERTLQETSALLKHMHERTP